MPQGGQAPPEPAVASSREPSTPFPAVTATSISAGAAPAPSTATRAPSATAILSSALALEPEAVVTLTPGTEVVVHPAATFAVELSVPAADARLVLVDGRDALVPSRDVRELAVATKLTLAPAEPLVPGSRYWLRLDGAADRDLHDAGGRAFSSVTLPILAAGAPPPPEPKKPARKRKRR
jgi:hypothetical protein